MVAPTINALDFEDVEIDVPTGSDTPYEAIPEDLYTVKLVGFKTVDKPEYKLKGEEGEDRKQWAWTVEIVDGPFAGKRFTDYTNRTWHEKATANHHAAAFLGKKTLEEPQGMTTRQLMYKVCRADIIVALNKKNEERNYIKELRPLAQKKTVSVPVTDRDIDF